jgi:hypothetical protein
MMATLRIEHAISDYGAWQQAFDSFSEAREKAGVRGFAIRRPVDDPKFVTLDLEFDTAQGAEEFSEFLYKQVWSSPMSSPALAGAPRTRVLDLVRSGEG